MAVLVVDDNATNRSILAEILSGWRMKVTCADGGRAALKAMAHAVADGHPIQLVLLDRMMPEMDGMKLAEKIGDDPRLRKTPLIMLSSASAQEHGDRYESLGIVGQLCKPVAPAELLDQILQILGEREAGQGRHPRGAVPSAARTVRILVADDGIINQKVAAGLLEAQGHRVTAVSNGRQAVAALENETFDLILMDIQMPEMDGLEATAAIRQSEIGTQRHVPIVAMTAHAIKGDQERFLQTGIDAYIPKPVEPRRLYAVVEQLTAPALLVRGDSEQPLQPETTSHNQAHQIGPLGHVDLAFTPVIDATVARTHIAGGDDGIREVAQLLRDEVPRLVQALRQTLVEQDAARLQREAHTLKGSAAVFGASSMVDLAEQLETMGRNGQLSDAPTTFERLESEVGPLDLALSTLIDSLGSERIS